MANNVNYRVPPAFEENKSYESWKNEIEMWKRVTELGKKKQALAVALSLTGRARDTALEITADDLNQDNGMKTLVEALDSVFLKEEKDRAYDAYTDFDNIKRENDVSMTDYIVHFEQRYNKMRKFDMVLPDAVLAFKLLDTASLDVKDKQLALTACSTLTFASMKSALKRIFGDKTVSPKCSRGIQVHQDAAFYVDQRRNDRRDGSKFHSQTNQGRAPLAGSNPLDRYGKRTKCAICQSIFHWAKDCPHKAEHVKLTEENAEAEQIDECNITLFSKESVSDAEILMVEALGSAVIDTACTRTVCGEKWLDSYVHTLKESDKKKMENVQSRRAFKFGDGQVVHSTKRVKVPAKIGQTKCHIETEVVPVDIPLLLSKTSLKRAKAVLDIENDKATMFHKPVSLEITSSGHYCVSIVDKDCLATCEDEPQADEVLAITEGMSKEGKDKVLVKPHKQFGQNPNLPSVLVDKPPALEGTTMSKWVGLHISALHEARTAFTEAECSERIRRALRTQLRPTDEHYETGDKVYYKRMDFNEWKGPGVVIGQDGVVIFVRHGGTYVRVHHCRLRKAKDHYTDESGDSKEESQTELEHNASEGDMDSVVDLPDTVSSDVDRVPDTENAAGGSNNDTDNNEHANDPSNRQPPIIRTDCSTSQGQFIKYVDRDTGISHRAKVLGRAGKASGKNKDWYNLEYTEPVSLTGTTRSADLSQVDTLQIESLDKVEQPSDRHHDDVLVTKDVSFESAKLTEISNWEKHGVFNKVKNMGQKCISTRWVCTLKDTADGIVPKARLVARGFEELNTKDLPKDSPTCASESLRLLMSVICLICMQNLLQGM